MSSSRLRLIAPALACLALIITHARAQGEDRTTDGIQSMPATVSFERDIQPLLTARGCNQGACHGKSRGQNGFQLSLLAFDPDFDFAALTQQARGRRVFPAAPDRSLILLKATATLPHGGGQRLEPGGD